MAHDCNKNKGDNWKYIWRCGHLKTVKYFFNSLKSGFLTILSAPTQRPNKCFYYAPEYNLNRFEVAQGFIASNHFNAKQSIVSFQRAFFVMSLSIKNSWISTGFENIKA